MPPRVSDLRFYSKVFSLLVIAIGLAILLGWILDIGFLKSIHPNWVNVKANTALCFVLAGASLWLRHLTVSLPSPLGGEGLG